MNSNVIDQSSQLRRWYFSVEDFDDNLEYLGPDGENIDEDTAKRHPFIGDYSAARDEADRRADRWEQREDAFPARVTAHSMGMVTQFSRKEVETQAADRATA